MKAVILAGGRGTRIAEETTVRPKPMVEIGGEPILWHIMKIYAAHGISDFIVCLGYKGQMIKDYFANYLLRMSDFTIDFATERIEVHQARAESWRVTLVDTGQETMTGGRLGRVERYLEPDEPFCLTYGDGVTDADIRATIDFHESHGKLATTLAVPPPGRFGALRRDGEVIREFAEKADNTDLISGGFFVLSPKVLGLIDGDDTVWERGPLEFLAQSGELMGFEHRGFWQAMDSLREKELLESLWRTGHAPWKVW